MTATQLKILKDVLTLPTSPFQERHVIRYVHQFCDRIGLALEEDAVGNLIGWHRPKGPTSGRPVILTAHMDHPGFEALRMSGPRQLQAKWRGGVLVKYFVGSRVRFDVAGQWVRGKIRHVKTFRPDKSKPPRVDTATIDVSQSVPVGAIGMWDIPDPRVRGRRIFARATDDLAGLAAMLCAAKRVLAKRPKRPFACLFTRAEEVGFAGTLYVCKKKWLPKRAIVINIENSSELPGVSMGDGPVIRAGDRISLFSPAVTAWLGDLAAVLAKKDKSFAVQRKLMDGGACEASSFCEFGYTTGAVCLALGNYHNMDKTKHKIAPEYIHLDDFDKLVKLLSAALRQDVPFRGDKQPVRTKMMRDLLTEHLPTLRKTVRANSVATS